MYSALILFATLCGCYFVVDFGFLYCGDQFPSILLLCYIVENESTVASKESYSEGCVHTNYFSFSVFSLLCSTCQVPFHYSCLILFWCHLSKLNQFRFPVIDHHNHYCTLLLYTPCYFGRMWSSKV